MSSLARDILESGKTVFQWADDAGLARGDLTLNLIDELSRDLILARAVASSRDARIADLIDKLGVAPIDSFLAVTIAVHTLASKSSSPIAINAQLATWPLLASIDDSGFGREMAKSVAETKVPRVSGCTCAGLARYAAVVASCQRFSTGDKFMAWVKANSSQLCEGIPNLATKWLKEAFADAEYPSFDLARVWGDGAYRVRKLYTDTESRFCRDLLRSSVEDGEKGGSIQTLCDPFFQEFEASLGFAPDSLEDFTVEVFDRQMRWFDGKHGSYDINSTNRFIRRFYLHVCSLLPPDQRQFSVETGLTPSILHHNTLFKYWKAGFRAVVHNPLDPPPSNPRWFMLPNEDEMTRTNMRPEPWVVDLSYPVPELERLVVGWIWTECDNVAGMRRIPSILKDYLSLVEEGGKPWRATSASVTKFLARKKQAMDRSGIRHVKGWLRSFLRYVQRTGIVEVDPSCIMLLSVSEKNRRWEPDASTAVPTSDLKAVLELLDKKSEGDSFYEIMYVALVTQSLTPLRIGDVLDLKRSDLVAGLDGTTMAVETSTKTDGYGRRRVQVPRGVGELLDAVVTLTDGLAQRALPEVRDCIFIYEGHARTAIKKVRVYELTRRLRIVCDEAGVPRFTPRNIRRRYETEVVLQGVKRNISRLALRPLTGHASIAVTERYYVREEIKEYLQAVHGIEIGQPVIKGEVASEVEADLCDSKNAVEGGAGYCRNSECDIAGTVTCLMCSGFVTEPGCIPEMEEAVMALDVRIAECGTCQHERDHLLSVKRLYLGYLSVMYEKREEARNVG